MPNPAYVKKGVAIVVLSETYVVGCIAIVAPVIYTVVACFRAVNRRGSIRGQRLRVCLCVRAYVRVCVCVLQGGGHHDVYSRARLRSSALGLNWTELVDTSRIDIRTNSGLTSHSVWVRSVFVW